MSATKITPKVKKLSRTPCFLLLVEPSNFSFEKNMRKNDVALLVGVILIKIASGMAMGLFGPMLPSLAKRLAS